MVAWRTNDGEQNGGEQMVANKWWQTNGGAQMVAEKRWRIGQNSGGQMVARSKRHGQMVADKMVR